MSQYEIMYIIDGKLEEIGPVRAKVEALLKGKQGKINHNIDLGLQELAYPIKQSKKGYYFLLMLDTAPENLLKFKEYARITKPLLRFLIISTALQKNYSETLKISASEIDEESFKPPIPYYVRKRLEQEEAAKSTTEKPASAPSTDTAGEQ